MLGSLAGGSDAEQRAVFDELCAKHLSALQAAARHICRDSTLASDLVQDTLERAWRKLSTLEDHASARAWLVRILRNTHLDQIRRRKVEVPLEEVEEPPSVVDEPMDWQRVTIEDVRAAIEQIEEPFRTTAILHDIDNCSYQEISSRLGVPYATAATRLHRARRMVRSILEAKLRGSLS